LGGTIFETRGRNPRTGVRGSGGEMMEMMEMMEKVSGAAEGGKKLAGAGGPTEPRRVSDASAECGFRFFKIGDSSANNH
ncbi:MAG: hypothetical protein N2039_15985, partial [Gemmataceae bacterium]|nr:hypothetical protein [Gemmataceae bacterium]